MALRRKFVKNEQIPVQICLRSTDMFIASILRRYKLRTDIQIITHRTYALGSTQFYSKFNDLVLRMKL